MTSTVEDVLGQAGTTPLAVASLFSAGDEASRSKALPRHAREHNRALIVRTLYTSGAQSRADLARATGLAKVTVSDLVAELLESGFVEELGPRKPKGPGKPAIVVDIAWDGFLIVAVDLSEHGVFRSSLVTLDATPVLELMIPTKGEKGEDALNLLMQLVADSLAQADRPVLGMGVGTPGLVTPSGEVRMAPNLGWRDVPLQAILEEEFGIPCIVINDANMAALGQDLFEDTADDFILVTIGEGVGAGLIMNRALVQGSGHAVGEIGHVDVEDGIPSGNKFDPGRVLERRIAVPALKDRLGAAPAEEREKVFREAGDRLGRMLAPIIAALDLSEVVLAGPKEILEGPFAKATSTAVKARILPETTEHLAIRVNEDVNRLVMLGCTSQVLATLFGVSRGQVSRSQRS